MSADVLAELSDVLTVLETETPRGLVIRSAKPSGFVAGADITEFGVMDDPDAIEALLKNGNAIFDRLDDLPCTTVAVVHGFCLGGGLELILACDRRIAIDGARFGFPEVLLGLHPGLGGSWRSIKLINPVEAMTMMLTGKTVHARQAKNRPRRCGDRGAPCARRGDGRDGRLASPLQAGAAEARDCRYRADRIRPSPVRPQDA